MSCGDKHYLGIVSVGENFKSCYFLAPHHRLFLSPLPPFIYEQLKENVTCGISVGLVCSCVL